MAIRSTAQLLSNSRTADSPGAPGVSGFHAGLASRLAACALLTRIASVGLAAVQALSGATAGPVTYYKHIAPILFAQCAPCHRPGEAGPFPLLTYQDARKRATQIAAATLRRYMPPWLPQPGYGDFADERRLTDAQIASIQEWARAGAPAGDPADAPAPPSFTPGWQSGPPDLVIAAAKPYELSPDGPDVFWNFILPASELRGPRQVKLVEIRPGDPRVVHHANLLIDRSRSQRRREKIPGEGFPGMDLVIGSDTFDPDSHFLFWKPGASFSDEPAGMSWRVDPGDDLILNVHLRHSGKRELVQPSIGLHFTSERQTKYPMLVQLEHDGALDIPPGVRDFAVSDDFRLPLDADLLAIYPHAHYLGTLLEGFATLPDGTRRWLIRIPHWDLNWQSVYHYREPVFLPKGTLVSMRFHYDNSAANPRNPNSPPRRVQSGDRAADEMGHLWLQLLPRAGGDQRAVLQEAVMRRRLEKYPADFSAHFNLGALYLNRRDFPAAIAHLRAAIQAEPEQPAALNALGAALESEGRLEDAAAQFRHVLRIQPDHAQARYNLANTLAALGKKDEAAQTLRELLAATPEDRGTRGRLVELLVEAGDSAAAAGGTPKALACYRELVTLKPADAGFRNNFGILLARSGDLSSALQQFQEAVRLDPGREAARRNLELTRSRIAARKAVK